MRHLNRRRYTMMTALAALAVVAVLSMWGPWSPRVVARDDPAGTTIAMVTPPRAPTAPIAPETGR
jgi:hypothetical protein